MQHLFARRNLLSFIALLFALSCAGSRRPESTKDAAKAELLRRSRAPEAARSCADLDGVNLAIAEQHMKQRGRPFKLEKYQYPGPPKQTFIRTGRDLFELMKPSFEGQCITTQGGFIGLIASAFEEGDGGDDMMYWSVSLDVLAYLPKGADPHFAAQPQRVKLDECSYCASEMADLTAKSCKLRAARDLDRDGKLEIFLSRHEQPHETGCCTGESNIPTYYYDIKSINNNTTIPYKQISNIKFRDDRNPVVDYDHDGREDFWSPLDYDVPTSCQQKDQDGQYPRFLWHARPDGTFVNDDQTARAAAKAWCPRPPTEPLEKLPPSRLAAYVVCARLWGESAAQLGARIERRCTRNPAGSEEETRDLPWMWCYQRGIECTHADLPGLCGDWLKELIAVQPPFRLQ